ncbi:MULTISPECIES: hypothetical protein [unclassified Mesorhizobium]|uniref:hypothetical protein n=1 Tax=unclassified Mesorhizobium TaxID=325217 RepID=UPI00333DC4F6
MSDGFAEAGGNEATGGSDGTCLGDGGKDGAWLATGGWLAPVSKVVTLYFAISLMDR